MSVNDKVLDEKDKMSMDKFKPLVFDHGSGDYLKVDGVVDKAFEVGKKLIK